MRHGPLTFLLMGWALCLLACTAGTEPEERSGEVALSRLVSQRVTATVKREAMRLVRIETEHEAFITTPAHPFATARSGWIHAGRLVPGDSVVSARFGPRRIVSVRSETPAHPVAVFNLSVDRSHAYFVGADQVLVHNTQCNSKDFESREETIAQKTAEREAVWRELEELKNTKPKSDEHEAELQARIAELKQERDRLTNELSRLNTKQRKLLRVAPPPRREYERQRVEVAHQAAREELDAAQKKLLDLEGQPRNSHAEKKAFQEQKSALEKQIKQLQLVYDKWATLLALEWKFVELEARVPKTNTERLALQQEKAKLTSEMKTVRASVRGLNYERRKREMPESEEKRREDVRRNRQRRLQNAEHEANTGRPRDKLERLEQELADLRREPGSDRHDERIQHLTERIQTLKELVELQRQFDQVNGEFRLARQRLERRRNQGFGTTKSEPRTAALAEELLTIRTKRARVQVKEHLLALLDETGWTGAPHPIDQARLHEFERRLAAETLNDQELTAIERELGEPESLDAEFFEQIWREAEAAELQETLRQETQDVDASRTELEELLQKSPSPERDAEVESSLQGLWTELREERNAAQAADIALDNEYTYVQQTQGGPGSSSGATSAQQRLERIQRERMQLREDWRTRMQDRLADAQRRLEAARRSDRLPAEGAEAAIEQEIALFEHELRNPWL